MTTRKGLVLITLLMGSTSLATAQSPAIPHPNPMATAAVHTATPQHKHSYMSAKSSHNKTLKTAQQQPKQPH